jgi:hypothetical protein
MFKLLSHLILALAFVAQSLTPSLFAAEPTLPP